MKLSHKVLVANLVTVNLLAVMAGTLSFFFARSILQDVVGKNQLSIAVQTMAQVDQTLYERSLDIQAMTGEDFLQSLLRQERRSSAGDIKRIRELALVTGPWDVLRIVDQKGRIVLTTDDKELGMPVSREPHRLVGFEKAMEGRGYHSDLVIPDDTKIPTIMYAIPVRDKRNPKQPIIGVVLGNLSWRVIEEILEEMPVHRSAHAILVNREGVVIAVNRQDKSWVGLDLKEKTFIQDALAGHTQSIVAPEGKSLLGERALLSYLPQKGHRSYQPNEWSLVLETPADVTLIPASKTALKLVLVFGFALLLTGGIVMQFASRLVIRPIALMTKTVLSIRAGNLSEQVPVLSRDEIGELATSFNAMTTQIREGQEELEKKVADRTSELKRSQEHLRQAQKMEALGRLTGGIAHDFNNLLGIMIGYCELSLQDLKDDDPLRGNLKEIKEAGERATRLTRQLLAFSRKQILQPQVLNMNHVLSRIDQMLRRLIGEDINLITLLDPRLGQVKADLGQMEQVILNLALNARDAMPHGGKLTLETNNVNVVAENINLVGPVEPNQRPEVQASPYVMLSVSDTGKGMDAETMGHIFEPFFTTKGKGTGLGLSTVYGIVKQSGGHVSVYSEPGQGTGFKVYLPHVKAAAEPLPTKTPVSASLEGHETVLVVEDEEPLRALICRILREKGHAILEALSGQEALRVSDSHEGPIALLVTDVIMPGMSGRETAEKLALKRPGIKVLYLSGYTENVISHQGVLEAGIHFLQKPFASEALARKVREVIES